MSLTTSITEAFRLTHDEADRFSASKTAQLIAALPFLAGCDQAERTAVSHLAVYQLSLRGPSRFLFDHAPEDDVDLFRRLACISDFQGGDARVLGRGMRLLALQMVCGYARDQAKDTVTGEYNPLLEGAWHQQSLVARLINEIVDEPSPEMDGIMTVHEAQANWWAY